MGQRLIGESGGQTIAWATAWKSVWKRSTWTSGKSTLPLISSERAPRNVGKTAREKAKKEYLWQAGRPSPPGG
ncbi:hypothetical protein LNP74_15785 [Klebsiella pneumoniae subsp. pneumoniae]|nr:hypothetical protein [Klebsiella pneumoniae subsp. pneumoniae]